MADDDFNDFKNRWAVGKVEEPEAPRSAFSRILEILLWLAIVGIVAAVVIPEFAGHALESKDAVGTLVGFLLLPYLLAKVRRAQRAWLYPIVGFAALLGIFFANGLARGLGTRTVAREMLAALEQFEPETARSARSAEGDPARMKKILQAAMMRATQRAPDTDVIAFRDMIFQLVDTPAGVHRQRCAQFARGETFGVKTTPEEELQIARIMTRLFRAAATHPEPLPIDAERALALRERAIREADTQGVMSDPALAASLTPDQSCDLYLRMMRAVRRLPDADAALIMRANLAGRS